MGNLSERQLKAIPFIVSSPTYTEGTRRAKISRKTFYQWLKREDFKQELARQREQVAGEAFGVLEQSLTKAVEALADLLGSDDERIRRSVANDIIDHVAKHKEAVEFEERLATIEDAVTDKSH